MKVGQKLYSAYGDEEFRVSLDTWVVSSIKRSPRRRSMYIKDRPPTGPVYVYVRLNGGKHRWDRNRFELDRWPHGVRMFSASPQAAYAKVARSLKRDVESHESWLEDLKDPAAITDAKKGLKMLRSNVTIATKRSKPS